VSSVFPDAGRVAPGLEVTLRGAHITERGVTAVICDGDETRAAALAHRVAREGVAALLSPADHAADQTCIVWDNAGHVAAYRATNGLPPLYYAANAHGLRVGSEFDAIADAGDIVAIDASALRRFLADGYVPPGRTFAEGVRTVPPGCVLLRDADGMRVRAAERARGAKDTRMRAAEGARDAGDTGARAGDPVAALESALAGAVARALSSGAPGDAPSGIFLSSGYASGVLLALARAANTTPLFTYTLQFDEAPPTSDPEYAARLARRFGATHTEVMHPASAVRAILPHLTRALGVPDADPRAVVTYLLALAAAREVTRVLTGANDVCCARGRMKGAGASPEQELFESGVCGDETDSAPKVETTRDVPLAPSAIGALNVETRARRIALCSSAWQVDTRAPLLDSSVTRVLRDARRPSALLDALAKRLLPGEVVRRPPERMEYPLALWVAESLEEYVAVNHLARDGHLSAADVRDAVATFRASRTNTAELWRIILAEAWYRVFAGGDPAGRLARSALPGARACVHVRGAASATAPSRAEAPSHRMTEPPARATRRPRLLVVGPLPPPMGGVQIANQLLILSSLADDADIHVVDTSKKALRWAVESTSWRAPFDFARHATRLTWRILRLRPDVVYVHAASGYSFLRDWALMCVARACGRRVVCHYHGTVHTRFPSAETPWGRRIGRLLMRAAHRIIVLGPTYRREFGAAWRRSDLHVVPNLADVSLFRGVAYDIPPPWLHAGEKRVLFVGRLSAPKGIWDLFDAMPAVIAQHPDVRFLLLGVAEDEARELPLRTHVAEHGLGDHVTFLGSLQGATKVLVYTSASVVVLPSWTEAFPLVIPEAYAAGVPVVVTAVGAIPDYVTNGEDGCLVPPHDARALADRINRLLADEATRARMSAHVRARAAREFDVETGAARVREVIRT
jgi:glycosyltransferase involved in cell wall biosynthesis/asparagine synthetase B (glutamine-hydrolysing)